MQKKDQSRSDQVRDQHSREAGQLSLKGTPHPFQTTNMFDLFTIGKKLIQDKINNVADLKRAGRGYQVERKILLANDQAQE